jgi:hypothetical protein
MTPRSLWLLMLSLLAVPLPASACSIPVFRYALERWKPAPYEAVVFHKGPLPEAARALVERLDEPATPLNLTVTTVDLAGKLEDRPRLLWANQPKEAADALPWLVLRFPSSDDKTPPAHAGPLRKADLRPLLHSPVREQIARHLGRGISAVWLLLESGNAQADRAAGELLQKELARLEKVLELPPQTAEGPQVRSQLPLRIAFAIVRLSRQDKAERALVRMLLHSDDDLDSVREPIVFPIFGRGRALCALCGKELNGKEIDRAGRFLCGACSCQVKELNPGIDLLFSTDWDALIDVSATAAPATVIPAVPSASTSAPNPPQDSSTAQDVIAPQEHAQGDGRRWLIAGVISAGILVLLTGIWVLTQRRAPAP